jgi:CubicO group peptidase (beta-lactamase class C family)
VGSRPSGRLFSFRAAAGLAGLARWRPRGRPPGLDDAVARIGALSGVRTVHVRAGRSPRGPRRRRQRISRRQSASKSVLAALVGIALERGLLSGLDAPLAALLPADAQRLDDPAWAITLRHLLTMTLRPGRPRASTGRWVASRMGARRPGAPARAAVAGDGLIYSTGNPD